MLDFITVDFNISKFEDINTEIGWLSQMLSLVSVGKTVGGSFCSFI